MRNLHDMDIDKWRDRSDAVLRHFGSFGNEKAGRFTVIPIGHRTPLIVIAASDMEWDHVSVSAPGRTPTWSEMDAIKRMFFEDHEVAYQLHVPPKDHINNNPHVLHIWRPLNQAIPLPPKWMV